MSDSYTIFCDGACSGNPGPGGWGAILLTPDENIEEMGGAARNTTNNQMELTAAIEALARVPEGTTEPVAVYTDSSYVINGITKWIFGWRNKGWKSTTGAPVANQPLWERLLAQTMRLGSKRLRWNYVPGHSGVAGNERADEIAVSFTSGGSFSPYRGPASAYGHRLLPVTVPEGGVKKKSSSSKKGGYYLSLVNDVLEKHTDWKSCEARVKGRPNAKYKKVSNSEEESLVLAQWGKT